MHAYSRPSATCNLAVIPLTPPIYLFFSFPQIHRSGAGVEGGFLLSESRVSHFHFCAQLIFSTLWERKLASLPGWPISYSIRWPKHPLLQQNSFKFAEFRLYGTKMVRPKRWSSANFNPCCYRSRSFFHIIEQKNRPAQRRSQFYFLESSFLFLCRDMMWPIKEVQIRIHHTYIVLRVTILYDITCVYKHIEMYSKMFRLQRYLGAV